MATDTNKKIKKNTKLRNISPLYRIKAMIKKEFQIFNSDKINRFIALILPPLVIVIFSIQTRNATPLPPVPIAIVGNDAIPHFIDPYNSTMLEMYLNNQNVTADNLANYSIPFITACQSDPKINLVTVFNSSQDPYAMVKAREMLQNQEIRMIVVIPTIFSENLINGLPATIECILDSSNDEEIQRSLNALQSAINNFEKNNHLDPSLVVIREDHYGLKTDDWVLQTYNARVIFTLPFILFGIAMVLTILVVVKEAPTPRLFLTPLGRVELLTSKFITYLLILVFQVVMILIVMLLMGLQVASSVYFDLLLAMFLTGFSGMSLGILISVISNTKTEANQYFFAILIVFTLLSGMFIPIDSMPWYFQILANIFPLGHGSPLLAQTINKAVPLSLSDYHIQYLLGFIGVCIFLAYFLYSRKNYEV